MSKIPFHIYATIIDIDCVCRKGGESYYNNRKSLDQKSLEQHWLMDLSEAMEMFPTCAVQYGSH